MPCVLPVTRAAPFEGKGLVDMLAVFWDCLYVSGLELVDNRPSARKPLGISDLRESVGATPTSQACLAAEESHEGAKT